MNEKDFKTFDAAEFLDNDEMIAACLSDVMQDDNPALLASALVAAVKARGINQLARECGVERDCLYKMLTQASDISLDNVARIIAALKGDSQKATAKKRAYAGSHIC